MTDSSSDHWWKAAKLLGLTAFSVGLNHILYGYLRPKTLKKITNKNKVKTLPSMAKL